jgi:hypothetical protein
MINYLLHEKGKKMFRINDDFFQDGSCNESKEKPRIMWTIVFFFIVIAVLFVGYNRYVLHRDIDAKIDRAQTSGDREVFVERLEDLKEHMMKHGANEGHIALVFKTDLTDMALHYQTIQEQIDRLEDIKDLKVSDTAYATTLDDVRGVVRELPNPADGLLWVKYGWWCLALLSLFALFAYLVEGPPVKD